MRTTCCWGLIDHRGPSLICPTGSLLIALSIPIRKNISVFSYPKSHLELFASRPEEEGRWPSSRTLGWDAVDAAALSARKVAGQVERSVSGTEHADERRLLWTAKSCGPDAPTLASSSRRHVGSTELRQPISASDGGKRARSPGRARKKPLKPLRAGMPGDPGATVVTTRVLSTFAHEAAGATGTRHSPRPQGGGSKCTTRAPRAARTKSYPK